MKAAWHVGVDRTRERIHTLIDAGRMKCVYERRKTYADYEARRPVYIEIGERDT